MDLTRFSSFIKPCCVNKYKIVTYESARVRGLVLRALRLDIVTIIGKFQESLAIASGPSSYQPVYRSGIEAEVSSG